MVLGWSGKNGMTVQYHVVVDFKENDGLVKNRSMVEEIVRAKVRSLSHANLENAQVVIFRKNYIKCHFGVFS